MIAPLRSFHSSPASETLVEARHMVAATLLPTERTASRAVVPAWQAWLLCTWMTVITLVYIARMVGIW